LSSWIDAETDRFFPQADGIGCSTSSISSCPSLAAVVKINQKTGTWPQTRTSNGADFDTRQVEITWDKPSFWLDEAGLVS